MQSIRNLIAGVALIALCSSGWAEDIEEALSGLVNSALSYEGRPLSGAQLGELEAILVQIEEKIMYLQGIGGRRAIEFLSETLTRISTHQRRLEQPREKAHRQRLDLTGKIGEIQDKLGQPGPMDTNLRAALQAQLAKLKAELDEAVAPKSPITVYWLLVRGVTGFGKERALAGLGDIIVKNRDSNLAHDLMFGLQGNRAPGLVGVYDRVLQKCSPELAIMAAEQLGGLKQQESIEVLLDAFRKHKRSPPVLHAVGEALEKLTGQPHGEHGDLWKAWWKGAKEVGVERTASGMFIKAGEAESSVAEKRNPDVKVLVLTQRCPSVGSGEFDRIQMVCSTNGIQHEVMTKEDFNAQKIDLDRFSAILVNCTQYREHCHGETCKTGKVDSFRMKNCTGPGPHEIKAHLLDASSLARIKAFVKGGGFLFTEDWGLIEITRQIFPAFITSSPRSVQTSAEFMREQDVDVNPPSGVASHHLLRGVYQFHSVGDDEIAEAEGGTDASVRVDKLLHKWHVDDQSPAMIVLDTQRVTVLLTSNTVADLAGTRGACAVTFFPFGVDSRFMMDATLDKRAKNGGRVLHILSHFTKQSKIEDERAVKRLLLNFVEEAAWAWDARQRRKSKD